MSKILLLDIETAPNLAFVWGAWRQNVGANQWVDKSIILSFAAKWLDSDDMIYADLRRGGEKLLLRDMWSLLNEADIVVAHNGNKFDIPTILGRMLVNGISPPSPFHKVDTLRVAQKEFRFPSNSLAALAKDLGLPEKEDHKKFPGFELWVEVLKNNPEAWEEMKEYNIQDVVVLEALYLKMRPYMRNHPNVGHSDEVACAKCGETHIQWRGIYRTKMGIPYRRYQCQSCGGWGRTRNLDKNLNVSTGRNAV